MDRTQEPPKKCFCARCFLPVEPNDRVDIEGQSFHRCCSTCCVCQTIPTSLKMFYGHVFCADCFKSHVLSRFRGESPRIHANSWWMQWAPGSQPHAANNESKETKPETPETPQEPPKKCICARCLQSVDESSKVTIGGQTFHPQCAKCYFCHCIPNDNVKIYYGQVFCEECFFKHILNRNQDNPSEFFKGCLDQWQNNPKFVENMKEFLAGNKETSPFVFMMSGQQPPFCRFGNGPQQEWCQNNEPKKSATLAVSTGDDLLEPWGLTLDDVTISTGDDLGLTLDDVTVSTGDDLGLTLDDVAYDSGSKIPPKSSPISESANVENSNFVSAAEKIEKLTKYLNDKGRSGPQKCLKKWKNFNDNAKLSTDSDAESACSGWVNLQISKTFSKTRLNCPKCLWQCGPIYVNSDYL